MFKLKLTRIRVVGFLFLFAGVLIGIIFSLNLFAVLTLPEGIKSFLINISTELISIAITVLLIDWLYEQKQENQLKAQLIREMGSSDLGFAARATRELAARGNLRVILVGFEDDVNTKGLQK